MWVALKNWIFSVVYGLDLTLNAVIAGSPRETISSRCYRLNHILAYRVLEVIINTLAYPFDGPDHCRQSYLNIVNGTYLPWEFFDRAYQQALIIDKGI